MSGQCVMQFPIQPWGVRLKELREEASILLPFPLLPRGQGIGRLAFCKGKVPLVALLHGGPVQGTTTHDDSGFKLFCH